MNEPFTTLDSVLAEWLPQYGLTLYSLHQDEQVRLIHVIDDKELRYEIWIESPSNGKSFTIRAHWDLGKKINRQRVTKSWKKKSQLSDLFQTLDMAYEEVERWIAANGNTRTWVSP